MQPIRSSLLGLCTLVAILSTGFISGIQTAKAVLSSSVYIHSTVGNPWGSTSNDTAMDRAFGTSNWQDLRYELVSAASLFSPSNQFIFMEGSDYNAYEMQAFLTTNMAAMQSWVAGGGRLLLNAAPNEGTGMSFGFGATLSYNYPATATATGIVSNTLHPIFSGPFTPVGQSWTGNSFGHAFVTGTNIQSLIVNSVNGNVVLGEQRFGSGLVLFGGMTTDNYHSPQPEASNLRANILSYTAHTQLCTNCPPTIWSQPANQNVPTGATAQFAVGAAGTSLRYFWLRDGAYIPGATNSIYTTNNVQLSDSGAQFSCVVSNAFGATVTSNATLTVYVGPSDWFTEVFDWSVRTNDLSYHSLTFTPDGSPNFYSVCEDLVANYATDPSAAVTLPLYSHSYLQLSLSNNISIFSQATNVIYLASEGHITLGSPDTSGGATLANHFSRARISASFAHYHPEYGGTISWLQLSNRVAITFDKVYNYDSGKSDSFQMELFYDGRIRLTFMAVSSAGVVGLSSGQGLAQNFSISDLSSYTSCGPNPPTIITQPRSQTVETNRSATFSVFAIGSLPMHYFWQRDGQFIAGATNSFYTTNNLTLSDSGAQFSCLVSNAFGTMQSSNATLTVVLPPTDWFTEQFDGVNKTNDLSYRMITFTPNGGRNFYDVCEDSAGLFPTDPAGGTVLGLGSHTAMQLVLSNNISIYGQATNVIYLASEGHITFGSSDTSGSATFANHFSRPRVSASFAHLHPSDSNGKVFWQQLSNRVVITFDHVVDFDTGRTNSFQMELFHDGRIRMTFLAIGAPRGLVGLSAGQGTPTNFVASDLTGYIPCGPQPPTIVFHPASQTVPTGRKVSFSVGAFGSDPMSYFWLRDGQYIANATNSIYTTGNVQLSDSGAQFSCLVSNVIGSAVSSNATLTTVLGPSDWFTEMFNASSNTNDLAYKTFSFTPNGSPNFYDVCQSIAGTFPTDPTGGTLLSLGSHTALQLFLSNNISIYGQATNVIYLASEGHITLNGADTSGNTTFANHFSKVRVSASSAHLHPDSGRTVSLSQLATHIAITFNKVIDYDSGKTNSFQIELFFDGRIRLTFLETGASRGLVGLSAGQGVSQYFLSSDFSTYDSCGPQPPAFTTQPADQTIPVGRDASFTASAFGSSPINYFWLRDGQYIDGATASVYTITNAQLSDSGALFSCIVSNAFGFIQSTNATLTVAPSPNEWFTEVFDGYTKVNDLSYRTLTFTPNGSLNFYDVCEDAIGFFPTDPTGGLDLGLGSHSYTQLTLSSNISIYGQATNVIFLASEGHITLGVPDTSGTRTFANHFSLPRVSASFAHLHPGASGGGTVSLLQLTNRVAITFDKVMDYDTGRANSFQIELFFDGRIRLTFLDIGAPAGLVGLSAGKGMSPFFESSDLSAYDSCGMQPPFIGLQPGNLPLTVGQTGIFTVGASGGSLNYSWRRNGQTIAGATDSSYLLTDVQLSDSGATFSCLVSNALGTALSSNALLTVTLAPPIFESFSYDLSIGEGEDASISPYVISDTPLSYQWLHNGKKIPSGTDQTLFFLNASMADEGSYQLVAANIGGKATSDVYYVSIYQTSPTILSVTESVTALPGGFSTLMVEARGSHPLNFQWQKDGYNLQSQTNATLKVANVAASQGNYRVILSNPVGVIASLDIPFTLETNLTDWGALYGGTYRGLFYDESGFYGNNGYEISIKHSNSGFFSLRVMRNGAFSGQLQVDGNQLPFFGKFDATGQVALKVSRAAVGKDPLFVTLSLSPYDNSISGTVTCNRWRAETASDFYTALYGYRSVYNAANPYPYAGRYTMNLDSIAEQTGFSHCCINISSKGNLMMTGNLADGTPFAQNVPISEFGSWPLYVPLYPKPAQTAAGHRNKGSVIGWITLDPYAYSTLYGTVNWRKEADRHFRFYPNGFDLQTTAFGGSYVPPTSYLDATATFSQGDLETELNQPAMLYDNHFTINGLTATSKVDLVTGRVTGTFVAPGGTRTNRFTGVINQQFSGIYGQFLGTNSSGTFSVTVDAF